MLSKNPPAPKQLPPPERSEAATPINPALSRFASLVRAAAATHMAEEAARIEREPAQKSGAKQ